jgi:large subunit ribosomal protein L10
VGFARVAVGLRRGRTEGGKGVLKRSEKEEWLASIHAKLRSAEAIFLVDYRGLDVAEVSQLRRRLRDGGGELEVVKNTLLRRAAVGTEGERLSDLFSGPTALAIAKGDAVAPAKVLTEFAKDVPKLVLRAGVLSGRRLEKAEIAKLASLPSLNELRSRLLLALQGPSAKLVRLLATPGGQVARVIALRRDELPAPPGAEPTA